MECDTAFITLKKCLITAAPILAFPDYSRPFLLNTDASQEGIGAVLSQEIDGEERVKAYASKALSKAERKYMYSMTRRVLFILFLYYLIHSKEERVAPEG